MRPTTTMVCIALVGYFAAILTQVHGAATSQTDITQLKVLWEAMRGEFWNYTTLNSAVNASTYDGILGTVRWTFDTDANGVFTIDPCNTAPQSEVLPQQHFAGLICKQNENVFTVHTIVVRNASVYGGTIPPDLSITGLTHLDLSYNGLTGRLPESQRLPQGIHTLTLVGNQVCSCVCVKVTSTCLDVL